MQGTSLDDTIQVAADGKCRRLASEMLETRGMVPMTGYCLRCRESREIQGAQPVTMKNGRPATRGKCGECGATMFRMGKAS